MRRRQFFATIVLGKCVLIREGIVRILRGANFRTLTSVSRADDLPPSSLQSHQLLVLIVHTGDEFDVVVEQIEFLKDQNPKARIAVVADHYRLGDMVSAFRAGANSYFVDVMTCDVFIKSIELVMMGETIFPPAFTSYVLDSETLGRSAPREERPIVVAREDAPVQLSPREKSILHCLIEGDSNKSIARKIDIAEATVKVHVKAILRKIRVQNRTQAAIWGMNNGSLARPSSAGALPPAVDMSKQLPDSISVVPDIKSIEAPGFPPAFPVLTGHKVSHVVDVPPISRLIRKSVNRRIRINGTARLDK